MSQRNVQVRSSISIGCGKQIVAKSHTMGLILHHISNTCLIEQFFDIPAYNFLMFLFGIFKITVPDMSKSKATPLTHLNNKYQLQKCL